MAGSSYLRPLPIGPETVLGGSTAAVSVRPWAVMRPHRFVYCGDPNSFVIEDVRIGKHSQLGSAKGGMPADAFTACPDYLAKLEGSLDSPANWVHVLASLDNLYCDPLQVAMDFEMIVRNTTSFTRVFQGIVYTRWADDEALAVEAEDIREHAIRGLKRPVDAGLVSIGEAPKSAGDAPKKDLGNPVDPVRLVSTGTYVPCRRCKGTGGDPGVCGVCRGTGLMPKTIEADDDELVAMKKAVAEVPKPAKGDLDEEALLRMARSGS